MITFYLNGKAVEEQAIAADLTLLRYLRTRQSLTGTKEGCASGDCGACTVLVGELKQGKWSYHTINSCITFVSQLHNKSIITVEALAEEGVAHPAQKAIVAHHGSQCGFCTPGVVMSMAGFYEKTPNTPISRDSIEAALAGNLCRCTGYHPIIEATQAMLRKKQGNMANLWQPPAQPLDQRITQKQIGKAARKAVPPQTYGVVSESSQTWIPKDERTLKKLLAANPDAQLVAGATDLALQVTQSAIPINSLICLNQIEALQTIHITEKDVVIGATATYSQMEACLNHHFPEFGSLLKRLGSQQIRNQGTLGGNIINASPIGDASPVLIALEAEIELSSLDGDRTLPLDSFFIGYKKTRLKPGEYLRAIRIPRLKVNETLKVYKISKRLEDDISAVLMALKLSISHGNILAVHSGFGGMAATPARALNVEQALSNHPIQESLFVNAGNLLAKDFHPMSDVRASAAYRLQVAKGLLRKCFWELTHPKAISRIEQIQSTSPCQMLGSGESDIDKEEHCG